MESWARSRAEALIDEFERMDRVSPEVAADARRLVRQDRDGEALGLLLGD